MARLTKEQWELVRADYEVHGLSYSELSQKHGVGKSSISDKAKKQDWMKGKTEQIIQKKVNAIKELKETEQQTEHLTPLVRKCIDVEVNERLAQEQLFTNSAIKNQNIANQLLELPVVDEDGEPTGAIDLRDLNQHSQITARNKETVLGKNPDTAIQINNSTQTLTPEIAKAINKELEDEY